MPDAGTYLLTNVGFSLADTPVLTLQQNNSFLPFEPLGSTLALRFDTSERHCVGWRDITQGSLNVCPDNQVLDAKYEQCAACQQRTGFNPAFYNANSVSTQQEARNQEPHILYLARFGKGVIKVGISYAQRGISRLLEQGARDAVILDTFPTAHIARQYEARIAAMPDILETLQLRKKLSLLETVYAHADGERELRETKQRIEELLKVRFSGNEILNLDPLFFPSGTPDLSDGFCASDQKLVSGKVIGSLGTVLFCDYEGTPVYLPLKKFVGYTVELLHEQLPINLPPRQASLF